LAQSLARRRRALSYHPLLLHIACRPRRDERCTEAITVCAMPNL